MSFIATTVSWLGPYTESSYKAPLATFATNLLPLDQDSTNCDTALVIQPYSGGFPKSINCMEFCIVWLTFRKDLRQDLWKFHIPLCVLLQAYLSSPVRHPPNTKAKQQHISNKFSENAILVILFYHPRLISLPCNTCHACLAFTILASTIIVILSKPVNINPIYLNCSTLLSSTP